MGLQEWGFNLGHCLHLVEESIEWPCLASLSQVETVISSLTKDDLGSKGLCF